MNRPNVIFSEIFWMYWSSFGVISSFSSVFLLSCGYTNTEIGVLIAIGNVLSVIIQPIAANIADRSKTLNVIRISIIMTGMLGVFQIFTLFLQEKGMILFVVYIAMLGFSVSMQPLLNAMNVVCLRRGILIDYGIGRGMGSLGYSLMTLFLGWLVVKTSPKVLPIVGVFCVLLMIAGLLILNRKYDHNEPTSKTGLLFGEGENEQSISYGEFVKRHKLFLIMMGGIFLMFYDHQIINFFMLQVFENVGGNSSDMGTYYSLMSLLEIPALVCFTWINKKISTTTLLNISIVGLVLRALLMFLAPSPITVQLSLIVNPFGFPLFLVSIVKYINEIMDHREAVRGQSMYVMVITISAVVATFTGGMLLDTVGAKILLFICLVTCIAGAAVIIPLIQKVKKETIA
ncbi:PPP family 3-phenylpropionic acid transporter [Clostridiales Family XIII bacterium PM5-7]